MRWLFLLLLLLNAFYFVWSQQQRASQPLHLPVALPSQANEGAELRLLSEAPGHAPDTASAVSIDQKTCLFLGGFAAADQSLALQQRLLSIDIGATQQMMEANVGGDYWVYMPALASREASARLLRELQARKIDSYLIADGDQAGGVSIGIFPTQVLAEQVMQRLRLAGYQPYLRVLSRTGREYWLKVAPESRRLLDDGLLERLQKDFVGLRHQLMSCETIASAR